MLFPDKHIPIAKSIFGFGAYALEALEQPMTVDALWAEFQGVNNTPAYPAYQTFENLLLALVFLFSIGVIEQDGSGRIVRCD
jgi:hypothetical protein